MKTPAVPQRRADPISAGRIGEAGPSAFCGIERAEESDSSFKMREERESMPYSSLLFSISALSPSSYTPAHFSTGYERGYPEHAYPFTGPFYRTQHSVSSSTSAPLYQNAGLSSGRMDFTHRPEMNKGGDDVGMETQRLASDGQIRREACAKWP
jgi:hypothetical protein